MRYLQQGDEQFSGGVLELSRLGWMKENAYVTYLKFESDIDDNPVQIGWKIQSLKNDVLCLVGFPNSWAGLEKNIDLAQPFEFNVSKGIDNEGHEQVIRDWINPQAKIGELVQLGEDEFYPIVREEIVTISIGDYKRICMSVEWKTSEMICRECYDKKTGILLESLNQILWGGGGYSSRKKQINSTSIPDLLGNTAPKKCKNCGEDIPEDFKFCGNCGEPVDDRRCPKCSEVVPEKFRFCGKCGTQISDDQTRSY